MIKRAYAYLRVSTFQQVDGKSLTGQEEEMVLCQDLVQVKMRFSSS